MRITNNMIVDQFVKNVGANLSRLEKLQGEITTGKRLSRASDDPPAVSRSMTYRSTVAAGDQFIRNMDGALAWMNASDSALESATQVMQRVRELAVQGANDTLTISDQQKVATEVDALFNQMLIVANSSIRGQRLFAGSQINTDPFTGAGAYVGDTVLMQREVDTNATIAVNVPGSTAFGTAFTAITNLRNNLNAGNTTMITATDIGALDTALDTILTARADIGARMNRIDLTRERQTFVQVRIEDLLSKTEDVDFAEAITKFKNAEVVYQAALNAGSKVIQPSLMDYLR